MTWPHYSAARLTILERSGWAEDAIPPCRL
jgi:hypothetical protein